MSKRRLPLNLFSSEFSSISSLHMVDGWIIEFIQSTPKTFFFNLFNKMKLQHIFRQKNENHMTWNESNWNMLNIIFVLGIVMRGRFKWHDEFCLCIFCVTSSQKEFLFVTLSLVSYNDMQFHLNLANENISFHHQLASCNEWTNQCQMFITFLVLLPIKCARKIFSLGFDVDDNWSSFTVKQKFIAT